MAVEKKGQPIPSGSMYLAWSNARMGYVALRWAKAVGFMALNGVGGTILYQNFTYSTARPLIALTMVCIAMAGFNFIWLHLTWRSNEWIEIYVRKLDEMEQASGTESGIIMFSDPEYLSRPQDQKKDKRSARRKLNEMATFIFIIWSGIGGMCFISAIYMLGRGKW